MKHPILRFLIRLAGRLLDANISLTAAGVAFYAMLAVFPGLTATIAIWSMFADPLVIAQYLAVADDFIPPEAYQIFSEQINELLDAPHSVLGLGTLVSLGVTLFSARAGVGALILGLNVIHGQKPHHTIWNFILGYVLTIALVGVMLVALATVVIAPIVLNLLPFHDLTDTLVSGLPWAGMLILMLTALGILYRYGPNMPEHRVPILSFGSVMATVFWGAASLGLTYYLANFGSYNRIYGSIGAVIALLMWLYLSTFSVLFGAALNAEILGRKNRSGQDQ